MASPVIPPPSLVTGQRMSREEFLRRWEQLPELKNAELIEGVVIVAAPVSKRHSRRDILIHGLLLYYEAATPGCEAGCNETWLMLESVPQPDSFLRLLPEAGGSSADDGEYSEGAPELVFAICVTTAHRDLRRKQALYQRAGVREYVTVETDTKRIRWRRLGEDGSYVEMSVDPDGVHRSAVFPGLWLDVEAYWAQDVPRLQEVLKQGLASSEHGTFADQLRKRLTKATE